MSNSTLVKDVVQIARDAGKVIMDIYGTEDFKVESKSDESPLTIADRTANDVICKGLEALAIQYPIVSEENKEVPYGQRKEYSHFWLVDPLDGTKEFIKRNGEFTVNIALIHNQQTVMGIVYAPVMDEMYWAIKGDGAFMEKDGVVTKLTAPSFKMSDKGLKLVCSRSHLNADTEQFVADFDSPDLVSKGSSLKFLILAKGEAHIYPRLAPTMEWDTGAAQIVLEEAGGKVINNDTKTPLEYNKEILRNPYFIATANVVD